MGGSRCLPYKQDERTYRDMSIAKERCSENRRCVGIQRTEESGAPVYDYNDGSARTPSIDVFSLCLDAIYKNTAMDKYISSTYQTFKKAETPGRCTK